MEEITLTILRMVREGKVSREIAEATGHSAKAIRKLCKPLMDDGLLSNKPPGGFESWCGAYRVTEKGLAFLEEHE